MPAVSVPRLPCRGRPGRRPGLPAGPVERARRRGSASGAEVTGAVGANDEQAFFNYTDYEHNALRLFRVALTRLSGARSAAWPSLAEIRSEDLISLRPFAA